MLVKIAQKIKQEMASLRVGLVPGMAVLGLIILARYTGCLQSLELQFLDNLLRWRPPEALDERIVIIGIDETDIQRIGKYPIPDLEIAELLTTLIRYKPRVIGLDIIRDLPVEPGHNTLVKVLQDNPNIITIEKALPIEINPPPYLSSKQVGFSDAIVDLDGHIRRSLLSTPTKKGYKFSLTVRLAETYLLAEGIKLENGRHDENAMRFGQTEIPRFLPNWGGYVGADAGGVQVLLNFRSGREKFRILSLEDIKTKKFSPNWLTDRIVIIGVTSPGVDLSHSSATFTKNLGNGSVYGVEIQAHACSQIVNGVLEKRAFLKSFSQAEEYGFIIIFALIGISFGIKIHSPGKNMFFVIFCSFILIKITCILIINGWWFPVVPCLLGLMINGIGVAYFYQYHKNLKRQIQERQQILEQTFDTIHNGPLQTLAQLIQKTREQTLDNHELLSNLEFLNYELREIYQDMKQEIIEKKARFHLGDGSTVNLQFPLHEILYEIYTKTLKRDFPCFKTIKVQIRTFEPIDTQDINIEQKRGLCRFLEEALCNVGKYAIGATRLKVIYTRKDKQYILSIEDNGQGITFKKEGRGTQQAKNIARQLKGKFQRSSLFPKGTLCELTWPVAKS